MSGLGAFLRWWVAELIGLLPARLARRLRATPPVLVADPVGDGFRFGRLADGRWAPFAGDPAKAGLPLWLRLPAGMVLCRTMEWPAMAAADLRQAALLDLDRQTPLPAASLLADVVVRARDAASGRLTVEIAVARAEAVAPLVARLPVPPTGIGAATPEQPGSLRFRLTPAAADITAVAPQRRWLPARIRDRLALACVVLGMVNLALWQAAEQRRIDALDAAVEEARRRVRGVDALKRQVEERLRQRAELAGNPAAASLLVVLDELTRLLPDEAWLDSVEVRGGSVYVTGHAPAAAALVAPIERSPLFAEAQFRSPVVPDRTSGLERFDLAISLRGRS